MFKLRAGHMEFLTNNIDWANRQAACMFHAGYAVSIERI
jgi:hypothetical protein